MNSAFPYPVEWEEDRAALSLGLSWRLPCPLKVAFSVCTETGSQETRAALKSTKDLLDFKSFCQYWGYTCAPPWLPGYAFLT